MLAALPAKQFYAILVPGILANTASAAPPAFDLPVIRHQAMPPSSKSLREITVVSLPAHGPAARVALRA